MADWWDEDPPAEETGNWWDEDEAVAPEPMSFQGRVAQAREIAESPEVAQQAGRNIDEIVRGAADVFSFGLSDEAAAAARQAFQGEDYETALAEERARDEAANPALRLTGQVPAAIAYGATIGAPRNILQALTQSGVFGGLYGAGSGEGGAAERATEGLIGAGTGALTGTATYGLANVIAPQARDALQRLYREGVRPTVGQMMGPAASRLEESAMSVPVLGQMVRGARLRALEDFNRGAVNFALRPAGLAVDDATPIGRQTIAQADDLLSKGYNEALDIIQDARIDQTFADDIARISATAAGRLGNKGRRAFENAIADIQSLPAMKKPTFNGKDIKRAISGLRQDADRLSKNVDEDVYQAGQLIREVRDAMSDLMKRNTTPGNAARLTGLDRAYAGFQRVRDASEAGREGIFTPFQYNQAIKRAERASGRRDFARGGGMGQDLAEAAEEVISSRVPDSGTPERLAPYLIGGAAGAGYIDPLAGAAVATGVLPYTRAGQNVLAAIASRQASPGQQMLAESLRRAAAPVAAGAVVGRE